MFDLQGVLLSVKNFLGMTPEEQDEIVIEVLEEIENAEKRIWKAAEEAAEEDGGDPRHQGTIDRWMAEAEEIRQGEKIELETLLEELQKINTDKFNEAIEKIVNIFED